MSEHHHHHTVQKFSLALCLNTLFAIVEFISGFYFNSSAIIADAFHDMVDSIAIILAIITEKIALRKPNSKFHYGYGRYSILSALILSILLFSGSIIMCYEAIISINESKVVNSIGMLVIACVGVTVNGFVFYYFNKDKNKNQSSNEKAIMYHFVEDVLGWIAVLVGAVVIYFTKWYWVDTLLTIAISTYIAYNAIKLLLNTMKIFLQAAPESIDIEALKNEILVNKQILEVGKIRLWTLKEQQIVASLSLKIDDYQHIDEVKIALKNLLNRHDINDVTIEFYL